MDVTLRELHDDDLDRLFRFERDEAAVALAAFTRQDPTDRAAFDAHYGRVRADPFNLLRAVDVDGDFAGTVASFDTDGWREVTYWIDPARWGRGVASAGLLLLLDLEPVRPLRGRVAAHNIASQCVLERAGFERVGRDEAWADGVGAVTEEFVYRLG